MRKLNHLLSHLRTAAGLPQLREPPLFRAGALVSAVDGTPLGFVDREEPPRGLLPGDLILVASDGIETLPEAVLTRELTQGLAARHDAAGRSGNRSWVDRVSTRLLNAVESVNHGRQDNATVLVAYVNE